MGYLTAMPCVRRYMEVSTEVYALYLRYVSCDDAWPCSVDEEPPGVSSELCTQACRVERTHARERVLWEVAVLRLRLKPPT